MKQARFSFLCCWAKNEKKEDHREQGEEDDAITSRPLPDHPLDLRVAGSSLR